MPRCASRYPVSSLFSSVESPKPMVSTWTTDFVTVLDSCCTDSLKTCRGSLLSSLADSADFVGCSVCAAHSAGIIAKLRTAHPSKGRGIDIRVLLPHLN